MSDQNDTKTMLSTPQPHSAGLLYIIPDAGAFIVAHDGSWATQAELVKDERNQLFFNPKNYTYFDSIIASKINNQALHESSHANYSNFAGLRVNLAGLRNFLLAYEHVNGNFRQLHEMSLSRLQGIATSLGDALSNDKSGPFIRPLDKDVANIEGTGAREMYQYLLDSQDTPGKSKSALHNFKSLLNIPERKWNLPVIANTPFSPNNLAAPADPEFRQRTADETPKEIITDPLQQALAATESLVASANSLRSIDTLAEPPRAESVEEARKILRWLRNMEFTDRDVEEFLDQGTPPVVVAKKQALDKLVLIFAAHLRHAQMLNQEMLQTDVSVINARDAVTAIALEVAEHTRGELPPKHPMENRMDELIDSLPPQAELRQSQSVERLIETVELGLEQVSGTEIDMSATTRLLAMSERMSLSRHQLRSPERRKPPANEESVELAREVLRKMQNLSIGEQTLEQFIQYSNLKEKAAFAQQVEELCSVYKNLIIEAGQNNPTRYEDPDVRQASEALDCFEHSVKLMAVKEMPNSIASAQHIGAEAAHRPEEWQNMHKNTINRLVKSAEGALEKAIEDVSQQQDQEQDDNAVQDAIEQALQVSDQAKRKKKKRRGDSKGRSGKGGKRQRRQQQDINSDDYVLKQGRFSEDSKALRKEQKTKPALTGLKESDIAAIKELGGSLRDIANQLKDIGATVTTVTEGERIAPDDKSASQRILEREQQNQQYNKNNGLSV